ncbi:kinase-like protein [Lichtheimia hyalospora FSU 10163]|nr:kinase-like protein [Lichtheimia hyalospora FSU 10163]
MADSKEIVGILRGAHRNIENFAIVIRANAPTIIGSLPHSDFQIKDPRVSYFHAVIHTIKYQDDAIHVPFIQDLSDNGTYINHQPIGCRRTAALFQGCIVSFATSDYEFYYIPRKAFESALYENIEKTAATAIEQFIPNNGITASEEEHHSSQAKDGIIIRLTDLIAQGAEGSVYLAIPLKAQVYPVACKIRRQKSIRIQEEIEIMRYCQHIGILPLLSIHKPDPKKDCWYLLSPLASGGDLSWKIRHWQKAAEEDTKGEVPQYMSVIRCIFYQLAMAVYYLHNPYQDSRKQKLKRVIIHGDIKPSNILIYDNSNHPWVALGDFGSAFFKEKSDVRLTEGGTRPYWAPELFLKYKESGFTIQQPEKIDVWALGLILYEMIGHEHPLVKIESREPAEIARDVNEQEPKFDGPKWMNVDQRVKYIIQWCLRKDPRERPTIDELLRIGQPNEPETPQGGASEWIYGGCDMERFGEFVARSRAEKSIWSGQSFGNNAADSNPPSTTNQVEASKDIAGTMDHLYFKYNVGKHERDTIVNMTRKEKHIRPGQFPNNRSMLDVLDNNEHRSS